MATIIKKYRKVCVRSSRHNKFLVITDTGSYWSSDDGKGTCFSTVEKALEYVRTNFDTKHRDRYDVIAFYRHKGYLGWHYYFV